MIIHKDFGIVKLIEIKGSFGVEDAFQLRKTCLKQYQNEKLVFNLAEMSFVGSSGLLPLLKDLQSIALTGGLGVHLVGVQNEVKRLIHGLDMKGFKTFDDVHDAIVSWNQFDVAS